MEPITQALAAAALSRTGLKKIATRATLLLVVAALAPDLDLLSSLGGADAYLRFHRTLLHSLPGAILLAAALAALACLIDRRFKSSSASEPLRFSRAFILCGIAIAFHLLLDVCDSSGAQLLWPFHPAWYSWNLTASLDPWILGIFIVGLLLPELFNLVSEEIGERKKNRPGRRRWAIAALLFVMLYFLARNTLHARATDLLLSRSYNGSTPVRAGAFPSAVSPFEWRGIVATDTALVEVDVPLGPAGAFDPDRGLVHYKPDSSPALDAAQKTLVARRFLAYAKFPLASLEPREDGFHFELRDLRFPAGSASNDNIVAVIDLDSQLRVLRERFRFARERNR
ncbi:MAG: metal-dependent hydrolase [Candidatus Acidiferrales bacterium]